MIINFEYYFELYHWFLHSGKFPLAFETSLIKTIMSLNMLSIITICLTSKNKDFQFRLVLCLQKETCISQLSILMMTLHFCFTNSLHRTNMWIWVGYLHVYHPYRGTRNKSSCRSKIKSEFVRSISIRSSFILVWVVRSWFSPWMLMSADIISAKSVV